MTAADPRLVWYIARAAGLVAWALSATTVLWGLALSTRALGRDRAVASLDRPGHRCSTIYLSAVRVLTPRRARRPARPANTPARAAQARTR